MSSPLCGALSRRTGNPCQNVSGKGTDHLGQGRCRLHGGATPVKHGLYSKVVRARLGQRMNEIGAHSDLLGLHDEIAMLKALLEQSVARQQSLAEAMRAWYQAGSAAYQMLLKSNNASEIRDALVAFRAAETLRPAELPDIDIVAKLVDKIGAAIERSRRGNTVCTRQQLQFILDCMGDIVGRHVDGEAADKIREGWLNIVMEGR